MADSVVSFLLEHLSQLLLREANLLFGVEDKIISLRNELEIINVYLKTSSQGKSNTELKQTVLSQIRDASHLAEDVIDTFITNVACYKNRNLPGRMLHSVDHAKLLHDVSEKIDKIKTVLKEIHENKMKYCEETSDQSTSAREEEERMKSLDRLRRNVEEDNVVGFVHESEVLINRLIQDGSPQLNVVSIIGMGGLGKTTLARKVYNSDRVKKHFNCRAWVYVSNECRVRELLLGLLQNLMPNNDFERRSISDDELKKRVRECLELKRYLLVLDDLWKIQDWEEVKDAFLVENKGSRILITSRLKEVASHTGRDPPHYLQFLSEEQSWELFSKKVFRGEEYPCDLESLGKQIVKSCGGLPLSIVVLAGLLANKEKSHKEWFKVFGHVNWYLTQTEAQVKDVLKLSLDNLPSRLKPCFLYLGIFTEDSEIRVRQLLQLWIAEGFIQETGSRDVRDVAEDYLYELIDRSLIQVAQVKDNRGVKSCRIHDLLRDLCILEGKENKIFQVCTENNISLTTKPRRLSVHSSMSHYVSSSTVDHSCVRSLFCYDPNHVYRDEWKWITENCKLVRVLDIEGLCCLKVPSNLGNFIHLRYLRINSQCFSSVPDSICNLQNLQTLDFLSSPWDSTISFPITISKLKHLKHVYTYRVIVLRGHRLKSNVGVMWNLQTISRIVLDTKTTYLISKGSFPKLRKLEVLISSKFKGHVPKMLLSLQQLKDLNKLEIEFVLMKDHSEVRWNINCKPVEVLQSLKHLSHLSILKIINACELGTCVAMFPPNITKLTLINITGFNGDQMNAFGNFAKLQSLILNAAYGMPSDYQCSIFDLNCVEDGFPQLQEFEMGNLPIRSWKLGNGSMPRLQILDIDECDKLDSLPSELWSLNTLRKVRVQNPSPALAATLHNLEVKKGCELIVEIE